MKNNSDITLCMANEISLKINDVFLYKTSWKNKLLKIITILSKHIEIDKISMSADSDFLNNNTLPAVAKEEILAQIQCYIYKDFFIKLKDDKFAFPYIKQ